VLNQTEQIISTQHEAHIMGEFVNRGRGCSRHHPAQPAADEPAALIAKMRKI
jgi:hypothetical protein